ncbi:MAG: diguanylate cyclase [Deltaproteobacteria bacterium]|nr:diguanylate cyclase [Deltaproteobacteria bacterium]
MSADGPLQARGASRMLFFRYGGAVVATGLVIVAGQLVVQHQLRVQRNDAQTLNLAGRQRTFSQKIAKFALAIASERERTANIGALHQALHGFTDDYRQLLSGRALSPTVQRMLQQIYHSQQAIVRAAERLLATPPPTADQVQLATAQILREERAFLGQMEVIVARLEREAAGRVQLLIATELACGTLLLALLVLTGLYIVRPALAKARRGIAQLEASRRQLAKAARIDEMTGLWNREHFEAHFAAEYRRAARERQPLSLLFVDLDHFRAINDNYGWPQGDDFLKQTAKIVARQARRPADVAARIGGEEFVLLLPQTDARGACFVAEQLRREISEIAPQQRLSASVGVASRVPGIDQSPLDLLEEADAVLYRAKRYGSNRVESSQLFYLRPPSSANAPQGIGEPQGDRANP